eukprot:839544-Rhodomonas_salina.1
MCIRDSPPSLRSCYALATQSPVLTEATLLRPRYCLRLHYVCGGAAAVRARCYLAPRYSGIPADTMPGTDHAYGPVGLSDV